MMGLSEVYVLEGRDKYTVNRLNYGVICLLFSVCDSLWCVWPDEGILGDVLAAPPLLSLILLLFNTSLLLLLLSTLSTHTKTKVLGIKNWLVMMKIKISLKQGKLCFFFRLAVASRQSAV